MIGVIGISHKSGQVGARERFVLHEKDIARCYAKAREKNAFDGFSILSTCNRTEVYYNRKIECKSGLNQFIINLLCEVKNAPVKEYETYFYAYNGDKAIRHLFEVICGIDSLVIGEDQILAQVKKAYSRTVEEHLTGTIFNKLFHKAFQVGKMVRTQTAINQGVSSVSYAAVVLAGKVLENLDSKFVLLVGAGETSELVLQSLKKKGVHNIMIANRTRSRAEELASCNGGRAIGLDEIPEQLYNADIVITSTSSEQPIITHQMVQQVYRNRPVNSPLFLFDLSMPRNVEEKVCELEAVHLYTIDDLEGIVAQNQENRKLEVVTAQKMIDAILAEFLEWISTLSLIPTIEMLNKKFDLVVDRRLSFIKSKVDEQEYEIVAKSSTYLRDKYVRLIVNNLRTLSDNGKKPEYIDMVNQLLELTKLR